jgi:hypothetical protein
MDMAGLRTARPSPVRWTDSHTPIGQQVVVRLLRKAGKRPSPQMLEEEAGRQPMRKAGPQLGSPSSPARMMNILEAEGNGEATTRLALPHHKAGGHHLG